MNLHQLRIFYSVATHGSYIKVARIRKVRASSINVSISNLHESIGCRLFVLNTFKGELTSEGKWLLPRAKVIVDELNSIESLFPNATRISKITVYQLKILQVLAISGSYLEAAKRANVHKDSVRKNKLTLEKSLGGCLVISSRRGIELTPEGKKLLPLAETITKQYAEIEEYFKALEKQTEELSAA